MVVSRISLGLAAAAIAAALQACSIVSAFTTTFIPVPTAKARRRVVESRAWAVKPNYYHVSCRSTSSNVRLLGMNAAAEPESGGEEPRSRRDVITGMGKAVAAAAVFTALSSAQPRDAQAFGPVKMMLTEPEYEAVPCPPKTQVPGEKAGAGLKPVCVKVTVTANNPTPKEIIDSAVFGFVYDEEGTSVVANNPDGASDAGQFAIIAKVPPGTSRVFFQFVAAIPPSEDFGQKKLKFSSLKAISYAGGKQYGAITECEMNPLAEECDFD